MNDPVGTGHEGRYELGIPTQVGPLSHRDIRVKDIILLLIGRKHLKVQTLKFFNMGI